MSVEYWVLGIVITTLLALLTIGITIWRFVWKFGKWQGEVDTDRHYFREFMKEVREDIEKIREDIKKIVGRLPSAAMVSESPLKLTELGQKISATLDAKTWAKARAEDLIAKTRDKDAFGIQSMAFEYARNFAPPPDMDKKFGTALSGTRWKIFP